MWFDSSSIANLAKNALKEGRNLEIYKLIAWRFLMENNSCNFPVSAQKHIDNVLDIKEEDEVESGGNDPKMVKSKTMPSIQDGTSSRKDQEDSVWGSFNGSFFENKPAQGPITNAPPRKSNPSSGN